jgi:hypothetical protein
MSKVWALLAGYLAGVIFTAGCALVWWANTDEQLH